METNLPSEIFACLGIVPTVNGYDSADLMGKFPKKISNFSLLLNERKTNINQILTLHQFNRNQVICNTEMHADFNC